MTKKLKVCDICKIEISKEKSKKLNVMCKDYSSYRSVAFQIKEATGKINVCHLCMIDFMIEYFKTR